MPGKKLFEVREVERDSSFLGAGDEGLVRELNLSV
jgi:hypothetical protein